MKNTIKLLAIVGLLSLLFVQVVSAEGISSQDKETFDEILEPVLKIYNLVKYVATTIASLVLLFAGVSYMVNGSDPKKRENSKNMAMYVIIGLVVIWAAPLVVQFVVG